MGRFVKCPRCDLNYMLVGEKYCKVCQQEVKGEHEKDAVEMCSICNEYPALPGRDVCLMCLKEMEGKPTPEENDAQADMIRDEDDVGEEETVVDSAEVNIPEDEELKSKLRDAENELESVETLVEAENQEEDSENNDNDEDGGDVM